MIGHRMGCRAATDTGSFGKLRALLIVLAVLAALAVGLLFAAPRLVDASAYRGEIERVAAAAAGQPVQINGDMSFRILPSPRLIAENIVVAPVAALSSLTPPLTARRAEIHLSLAGLLAGSLSVDSITLQQPVAVWQIGLAGHRNVSLTGSGAEVAALSIEGGEFRFIDERRGRRLTVTNINGRIGGEGAFDSIHGELRGLASDRGVALDVRMTAAERPALSVEIAIENTGAARFRGRLTRGGDWRAEGSVEFDVPDLGRLLRDSPLALAPEAGIGLAVGGRAVVSPGTLELAALSGSLGSAAFGGRLSLTDGDVVRADAALSFEQIQGDGVLPWVTGIARMAVAGKLVPGDSLPLEADLQFDAGLIALPDGFIRQASLDARYGAGVMRVRRLAALLPGGSDFAYVGDVRLTGGAFRLDGSVELASDNLAALLNAGGVPIQSEGHGRLRNLSLTSQISVDSAVAQVSGIDLRIDQSRMTGAAAVALVRRPSFSLNVGIDQINANAYAALFADGKNAGNLLFGEPDQPGMEWLAVFDTNARIRLGRLLVGERVARDLDVDARLIGGELEVRQLTVSDLDGSAIGLSGRIDTPDNPQWVLKADIAANREDAPPFAGLLGELPAAGLLRGLKTTIALEGGLTHSALDAVIRSTGLQGSIRGLVSDLRQDPHFDLDVSLEAGDAAAAFRELMRLELPGSAGGPINVVGQVAGNSDAVSVAGRLDVIGSRTEIEGDLALPLDAGDYDLAIRLRHGDLLQLMKLLNVGSPAGTATPVPLDISFSAKGNAGQTDASGIRATAGVNSVSGAAQIVWGEGLPEARIEARGLVLDVDAFFGHGEHGAAAAVRLDNRAFRWSRLPGEWPLLNRLKMTGELGVERVRVLGLDLADGTARFAMGPGKWLLAISDAGIGDGRVAALIDMETSGVQVLTASGRFTDVRADPLAVAFLGRETGRDSRLSLDFALQGRGLTEFDLVRSLSGGVNVAPETVLRLPGGVELGGVNGRLVIEGGVVRADPALSGDDGGRIVGSVDLGEWMADLEARGPGGNVLLGVSGPLQKPDIRP